MAHHITEPTELFPHLEHRDLQVVHEVKALIQDHLYSGGKHFPTCLTFCIYEINGHFFTSLIRYQKKYLWTYCRWRYVLQYLRRNVSWFLCRTYFYIGCTIHRKHCFSNETPLSCQLSKLSWFSKSFWFNYITVLGIPKQNKRHPPTITKIKKKNTRL